MEYTDAKTDILNRRVAEAVTSGTKPIELLFEPIYDCGGDDDIIAYRVGARVNSLLVGTLNPADYLCADVSEKLLTDLALRLIELLRLADGLLLRLIIFQRRGADGHGDGAQHQNDDEHIYQRVTAVVCSELFHAPPPFGTART